ncbi:MAG TPA: ribonuclease domain-containing protein [Pseudonocardiaceae bacterium]
MSPRTRVTAALVGLLALVLVGWLAGVGDDGRTRGTGDASGTSAAGVTAVATTPAATVPAGATPLSALPPQAAEVYRLIEAGGPFRYQQDGRVFGNREGRLPARRSGHYHEYTVPTPGEDDRGARRLVTGADGELYYTADHYVSFVRVDPGR